MLDSQYGYIFPWSDFRVPDPSPCSGRENSGKRYSSSLLRTSFRQMCVALKSLMEPWAEFGIYVSRIKLLFQDAHEFVCVLLDIMRVSLKARVYDRIATPIKCIFTIIFF